MATGEYEAPPREYSAGRMRVPDINRPGEGRLSERPYTQDELAADIRANGVQQPLAIEHLSVHPATTFNGLHRLDAAERAGVRDVPVVVKHRPGDYPPMTERRPATEQEFNDAYNLEREGRWAGEDEPGIRAQAESYRMQHTAPSPDAGHKPLHHYEGGDPDERVRIYRAAPAGTDAIHPGDWISLNPGYAHQHAIQDDNSEHDWPVYTAEVPQRHVHWDENDENEHGYNGPTIHYPDVHDRETGEHHDWHMWNEANPHGLEAWAGSSVHLNPEDHAFVHNDDEWESDRADRLMDAARAQGALRGAHWRDDLYPAREDAEAHAAARAVPPAGHQVTAFTVHRTDQGDVEGFGVHHYQSSHNPDEWRKYRHIDVEDQGYEHPAVDDVGRGPMRREAAVEEEYGPKPVWQRPPEGLTDEEHSADFDRQNAVKHAWESHILHGISTGRLHPDRAKDLGYYFDGHQTDRYGNPTWHPLPQHLYHVTTDLAGVRASGGLKSRAELEQRRGGHGLGGGPDDMISLTDSHETAQHILHAVHEFHGVVNGRYTPRQMWEDAKAGKDADRPYHRDIAQQYRDGWKDGDPLPDNMQDIFAGRERKRGEMYGTPEEVRAKHGHEWEPADEGWDAPKGHLHGTWTRPASEDYNRERNAQFYKTFAVNRAWAGGPEDPLFFSTDTKAFAAKDPRNFGIVHVRPRPGAMGHQVSALGEWRTGTGDALETHRAERLEGGHLKEATVTLAARYAAGLPNPQTGGDEWFHGTHGNPEDFVHGFSHNDSHDHEDEELRGHLSHWNTLLGSHFAADHGVAEHFANQGASTDSDEDDWGGEDNWGSRYRTAQPQSVIHARVHLRNPKVYDSEFDMDHEAYEHEYGQRKNYISKHFEDGYEDEDPHDEDYDPDSTPGGEEWPLAARYRHDDQQPIPRDQMQRRTMFSNPDMPEVPERTRWLNSHPDKAGIARRFKEHLEAQGHDGILYGNEFEDSHATGHGKHWNLSAITFHPRQAEITQHHQVGAPCLSREEGEHQRARMPQPGQEELPGAEEHAEQFPNGFLRGHAVAARPVPLPAPVTVTAALGEDEEDEEPEYDHPEHGNRDEDWGLYYHPDKGWHCHVCDDYHDDPETVQGHETAHTDWDRVYPHLPEEMHRGLRIDDDRRGGWYPEEHRGAAPEATAHAILERAGDLGPHWSATEGQARHYAGIGGDRGYRTPQGNDMYVVVHARKPEREHIETDPDTLASQDVIGFGDHDDAEVPLKEGAPVHVNGVSWKFHDEPEWHRHDLGQDHGRTAALTPGRLYHGTATEYRPGDEVKPEYAVGFRRGQGKVFATTKPDIALRYGNFKADTLRQNGQPDAVGRSYEIEPTGPIEPDDTIHEKFAGWRSARPFRVVRDVTGEFEAAPAVLPDNYGEEDGVHTAAVTAHFEEGGEEPLNTLDSFSYQAVQPYVAPPEDYEQGTAHLVEHHGYTPDMHMPRNLPGLRNVHRGLHLPGPGGPVQHQHDDPDVRHDPVFGSRQASLEATAMVFEPPGHFDFYNGEGSEDGRPRTSALEEHLHGHGGDLGHHYRLGDAVGNAWEEAYNTDPPSQRASRYHAALQGLHQGEHARMIENAREAVQHGASPDHPEHVRAALEGEHHQQWDDEWQQRGQEQEDLREHYENGEAHMHGRDVPFSEMESHLQTEHGIPSHALPQHRLPDSDYDDPYQRELEEMHEQHHGDHTLPDTGSYRHTPHGQYVTMHWGPRTDFDAESHLVEHHGMDINELRHDEPDLAEAHERDHAQNRNYLDHHLYSVMDPEGHLPGHHNYQGPDAEELREGDPEHHFEVHSHDEDGNEHSRVYHAEDEDHAQEMHEDQYPDEEVHRVGRAPVVPPRRQYTMPAQHADWEPQMGFTQPPNEHGTDADTEFSWRPAAYAAPPRSHDELLNHVVQHHGVTVSADSTKKPGQSFLLGLHDKFHHGELPDRGESPHQHDDPSGGAGHDPVFGSKGGALVAHFGGARPVELDSARDAVLAPAGPVQSCVAAAEGLGAWVPESAAAATEAVREFGEVLAALRDGVNRAARWLEDLPITADVADGLYGMAAHLNAAVGEAEDAARRLPREAPWEDSPNP